MTVTPSTLYQLLQSFFGNLDWWPVDSTYHSYHHTDPRFEILIGTILTQNTTWKNVEKALDNLKQAHALSIYQIQKLSHDQLTQLIKPSGFFNQKATRLQQLTNYLITRYQGDLNKLFSGDMIQRRLELLSLHGIGPETADSMLLYAGDIPIFVIDAYTKRMCHRLTITVSNDSYDEIQHRFQQDLNHHYPSDQLVCIYRQLHALIVECAKQFCRPKPLCSTCPLSTVCEYPCLK
ncbi:MAG: endonuclease [Candidatus Thermoplasmatota archaeon]|nr:endonuclease [Candidatus Thermoplasmatota archaeon]MBU1941189.1 endonuclease [Candidatus Thermoplasmatota archaeon]